MIPGTGFPVSSDQKNLENVRQDGTEQSAPESNVGLGGSLESDEAATVVLQSDGKEEDKTLPVVREAEEALVPIIASDEAAEGVLFAEHFQIDTLLGKGGMSKVYKAEDTRLKRIVAIKTLLPHLMEQEGSVLRFRREARSISDLKHDGIVQVYELGITKASSPFIVMEYLEGTPLDELIDQVGKVSYERAVPIFIQIAEAFEHAHAKGVIHRDLKPSNVVLRKNGSRPDSVCVVDFGLAKFMPHANKDSTSLTTSGDIFGSPPYMSPEQCQGGKIDARADIYSFGCLMYEVLTGTPPLVGETPIATVMKQVTELPSALNKYANVPPTLEALILKCLEKDPEKRQQSMTAVLADLRHFANLQEAGLEFKPTDLSVQFHQKVTRNKTWIYGLIALAVAVLLAYSWWYLWLTEYYGYEFTPRLITSTIVFAILGGMIGFPLYKLYELHRKMQVQELDDDVPRLAWVVPQTACDLTLEKVKEDTSSIVSSITGGTAGNGDQDLSQLKTMFQSLVLLGEFEEAEERCSDAIDALKERGEDKSALAYMFKEALGDASLAKGSFAMAEALYREAAYTSDLKQRSEKDGRMVELKLADSLYLQGRFADAQTLYNACLFATNRLGEPRDSEYAVRLSKLGDCYLQMGSYKQAEEQYAIAIPLWTDLGDAANKNLAYVKYAYTMAKRFKPMKADRTFALAVREIKEIFGPNSAQHIAALKLYASHLWRDGRRIEAYNQRKDADALEPVCINN